MRDFIRFLVNGREQQVRGRSVFKTLANYLREDLGATGTKVVCAEGDCGACTVLVRRGHSEFKAVNSCIQSLAQLDGCSIVTVEGIANGAALHPVQQSMIDNYGSQCGYCTPGFVVAMAELAERGPVDEEKARRGLTGNLCRCTGYDAIIESAVKSDCANQPKMCDRYRGFDDDGEAVLIEVEARTFFAPTSLDEAIRFKREHAPVTIVSGGTDFGVWVNKRGFTAPAIMSLTKIRELDELIQTDGQIAVGANVSLSAFETFIESRIPELYRIMTIFGSPQIRNAGTLAGNIANGSPIADTLPYLFVSGAQVELTGTNGSRLVAVENFYLGYKKLDLAADEIITRVLVPVVKDGFTTESAENAEASVLSAPSAVKNFLRLYKVSRRTDLDISAFTAAISMKVTGTKIVATKIAYGGVAPVVMRMPKLESFLTGKEAALETFEAAGAIAREEVSPISDVRGSREYRLLLCENILQKFFFDAFTEPVPVWSVPTGPASGLESPRRTSEVTA